MEVVGTDFTQVSGAGNDTTGVKGDVKDLVNAALTILANRGANAEILDPYGLYWSSSGLQDWAWGCFIGNDGTLIYSTQYSPTGVIRCSLILKDTDGYGQIAPQIGDVMYEDKTWGSAADYDGSKVPVGIVYAVSKNGKDATIISLKDLSFSGSNDNDDPVSGFDPDNIIPGYSNNIEWSYPSWIDSLPNSISEIDFVTLAKASDNCPCQFYPPE